MKLKVNTKALILQQYLAGDSFTAAQKHEGG